MEDVLDVYTRSYDARFPQVCMDETSKQLLREPRPASSVAPGRPRRVDYEYERNGVANLFLFCEPLGGRRWVEVTERRTRTDWADQIKDLVDRRYPDAERIVLVMDNLNTHSPASLYEAFAPAEAKRLADKLEIHHTPKHGSWLNMAESIQGILKRCALAGQHPTTPEEIIAWLEATAQGWNAQPTPFVWGGQRATRRVRARQRQQALSAELQAIAAQTNDRAAFLRLAETLSAFLAQMVKVS